MSTSALEWAATQASTSAAGRLYAAYTSGTLSLRNANGEMVTYNSPAQMLDVLSRLHVASVSTVARRPTTTIARIGVT